MSEPDATNAGNNQRLTGPAALLALADGRIFHGRSLGGEGHACGEVVFNTAMTGYQEILTDPSYASQLVTLTYPHIGNTGVNDQDSESAKVYAEALIVRSQPHVASNFRSSSTLPNYLKSNDTVAITDIDTRSLTRHLRTHGAQAGCIVAGDVEGAEEIALAKARGFGGLAGLDLASRVTTSRAYQWSDGLWQLEDAAVAATKKAGAQPKHVVAYDFGVKRNILRLLVDRGARVTVVPAQTGAADVLAMKPDGVFLSNGPGDPEPCGYAIAAIREIVDTAVPVFGICLGHQLLALASGGSTKKMKFGHHGANHPVQELASGRVYITSQNHGFAVDEVIGNKLQVTHRSLFDGSIQGLRRTDKPAFSFQGHPEASPGPHDICHLFDQFAALMEAQ